MIFSLFFWHSSSPGIFGICTVKKKKREEKDKEETEDGENVEFEKTRKSLELFQACQELIKDF